MSNALLELVELAKRTPVFPGVEWDSVVWDITAFQKEKSHKKRAFRLKFARRSAGRKVASQMVALPHQFSEFCKSLVKIKQSERVISFDPLQRLLDAARILCEVMEQAEIGEDIESVTRRHFIIAEEFILKEFSRATSYRMGKSLQEISVFIDRYNIAKNRIGYRSKIKRPRGEDLRTSEGQDLGMQKMPTFEIFDALAEISSSPLDENELIRIRIVDLLVVGGFRIGEVLTLPVNCWIEKPQYAEDGTHLVDKETGIPVVSFGLRYWPEKGGDPSIKWIPSHTVPLARRAVDDLISHCKKARERALIMESSPGYVPITTSANKRQEMTAGEFGEIVGAARGFEFISQLGIAPVRYDDSPSKSAMYRVQDVEKALLRRCGDLVIRKKVNGQVQMLSDSLCVCFYNQFKSSTTPFVFIAELVNEQHISDFLGGKAGRRSVFSRRGFKDAQGNPLSVNTHAFRHWLTTIADHGGLNELQLARWMGRKDIRHNDAYKHATVAQRVAWAKEMVAQGGLAGPIADVYHGLDPVDREQFLEAHVSTVHFTHLGVCLQDYSVDPCEYHLQCLQGCLNYLRTKGNVREKTNLENLEKLLELQIDHLRKSEIENLSGTNTFREHAERQLVGVKRALAVDDECSHTLNDHVNVFKDH